MREIKALLRQYERGINLYLCGMRSDLSKALFLLRKMSMTASNMSIAHTSMSWFDWYRNVFASDVMAKFTMSSTPNCLRKRAFHCWAAKWSQLRPSLAKIIALSRRWRRHQDVMRCINKRRSIAARSILISATDIIPIALWKAMRIMPFPSITSSRARRLPEAVMASRTSGKRFRK